MYQHQSIQYILKDKLNIMNQFHNNQQHKNNQFMKFYGVFLHKRYKN